MPAYKYNRVFLIVMDSVGIGEAPDAADFNDEGANTLGHIAEHMNGLHMPNMAKLGLGLIGDIKGVEKTEHPLAYYGKMQEASNGKDTMTGHWEIMGLYIDKPFKVFRKASLMNCFRSWKRDLDAKLSETSRLPAQRFWMNLARSTWRQGL